MELDKTFRVEAPQQKVWEFVTDAEKVATCMPGIDRVEVVAPGKFKGVMTMKVGPIKTVIKADVEETEQRAPEFASYSIKGEEGGRASRLSADATLQVSPIDEQFTEVNFTAAVTIVGRLGKFAGGVMDKLADSMSEQFIVAFRSQLEPQPVVVEEKAGLLARFVAWLKGLFGGG